MKPSLDDIVASLVIEYGAAEVRRAVRRSERNFVRREKRKRPAWGRYVQLYKEQSGVCRMCGHVMALIRGQVEVDHIDPDRMDFNAADNQQLLHTACNRQKGGKSLMELSKGTGKTLKEILK